MSLKDYRHKHPEYKTVSDRKLVDALYKVYGAMDETFKDFAIGLKAAHVKDRNVTEKEQRMGDAKRVVKTGAYIAERYTPDQTFEDTHGNIYQGQKSGQGLGLTSDVASKSLEQSLFVHEETMRKQSIQKQAGTEDDDIFWGTFMADRTPSRYADRDADYPGALKEAGKELIKGPATGIIEMEAGAAKAASLHTNRRLADIAKHRAHTYGTPEEKTMANRYTDEKQYAKTMEWQEKLNNVDWLKANPKFEQSAGFLEDVVKMGPQFLAQVGVTLATGPVGGGAYMGMYIAGQAYNEKVAAGMAPERARTAAFANAILQAIPEQLAVSKYLKFFKEKNTLLDGIHKLGNSLGLEWTTEFLQAQPETITDIWARGVDKSVIEMKTEYLARFWKTIQDGAYEGLVAIVIPGAGGAIKLGKTVIFPGPTSESVKADLIDTIDKSDLTEDQKTKSKEMINKSDKVMQPIDLDEMVKEEQKKDEEAFKEPVVETPKKKIKKQAKSDAVRKIPAKTIKESTNRSEVDGIVEYYAAMDDANMNRNDRARQQAAITQQRILKKFDDDSKQFTESMKPEPVQVQEEKLKTKRKELSQADKDLLKLRKEMKTQTKAQPPTKKEGVDARPIIEKNDLVTQEFAEERVPLQKMGIEHSSERVAKGPTSHQNIVDPVGQTPVRGKPHIGSFFTRRDLYIEQGGRSKEVGESYLESNDEKEVLFEMGMQNIESMEKDIHGGTFEYQFLIDELAKLGKVEYFIGNLNKIFAADNPSLKDSVTQGDRGATFTSEFDNKTGRVTGIKIGLFPELLAQDTSYEYSVGTLVHEMIHGLYRFKLGMKYSSQNKAFQQDIKKVWMDIPIDDLRQFEEWAAEYNHANLKGSKYAKRWAKYSADQQGFYQAWSQLLAAVRGTVNTDLSIDERSALWEEVMTYAFSRPEIMQRLAQIKSKNPQTNATENIFSRLYRAVLKFVLPLKQYQTVAADLLAVNDKWIGQTRGLSFEAQRVRAEDGQASFDLLIKDHPQFPKGAHKLQAALIDSSTDRVWVSPLGHWDIQGAPSGALDGFAAVDKSGKVLDYYTREEAGEMVDPDVKVIDPDGLALSSEDLSYINVSKETTGKKSLTPQDKALLDARKENRGGKTVADTFRDVHDANRKETASYRAKYGEVSRYDKLNPTARLSTMKPNTLEVEENKVRDVLREGGSDSKVRYYETRLQAIRLLQEKAANNRLAEQRIAEEKLAKDAGRTTKAQEKFFKAEYKRLIRLNAPYGSVQFAKENLLKLMGINEFFVWSGEAAPVKATKKKVVPKKDKEGKVVPTKVPEFTAKDHRERLKSDTDTLTDDIGEAREMLDKAMKHTRETYINTGKPMSPESVDVVIKVLKQAQQFDLIDETEMTDLASELAVAMTGGDVSKESLISRGDTKSKDPVQAIFDKRSPRQVQFDAYYSPSDGYVPAGYSFTITDRDSPAYGSSFAIPNLDKKTIKKKIKDAEDLRNVANVSREFNIIMDGEGVTKASGDFGKDSRIKIEFDHKHLPLDVGGKETIISFLLEEKGITPTYERYNFYNDVIKDKAKKGMQTIRMIQRMLFDLLNNQYNAEVPKQITFTGSTYDKGKNKTYKAFAQRLAKKLGWKLKVEKPFDGDPRFIITDPNIKKRDPLKAAMDELVSDDMPVYDSLVNHETQTLKDEPFVFDDDKMEAQATEGEKGIPTKHWYTKFAEWMRDDFKTYFREFAHLKRKEYGEFQYSLRQMKKGQTLSAAQAAKLLGKNIETLSTEEYKLLTRIAYMMDLNEQVDMNEQLRKEGKKVLVEKFPNGWTEKQIKTQTARLWDFVQANAKVKRAWHNRLDIWRVLRLNYVASMKSVGFDVKKRLNRSFYFRHQVLDALKAQHERFGLKGSGGKLAVPTRRSHLRKRTGGEYAMNLNYIQAEFEIMAQMIYDTQIADTLTDIMKKYGSKEKKDGYTLYQPREDTIFYMANSIPGKLAQNAIEAGLEDLKIPVDKIKPILALGGKYNGWYLPDNIAATLNTALEKPRRGMFMHGLKTSMRWWKMWQLLSPFRALKYNLRNLTGDAEAMFVGDAATFLYIRKSFRDIKTWKLTGKISEELQDWFDRGGSETTLQSQEMGALLTDPMFIKQLGKKSSKNPITWAARKIRSGTDAREMILRYAAYKRYVALQKKGPIKNYAASMPEEVDALSDARDKAFMMSNDLLGAYDRISVAGEALRSYYAPFWSFQEINMKRTLQFARNAVKNDDLMMMIGKKLGAKTVFGALKLGKLAFKLGVLQSSLQMWNMFMFPDEEDALPDEMHRRTHIIVGRGKDNILYFPRIGVLGDLLEWAGIDTAPTDVADIITGKKSFKQVVDSYNYGMENATDILNKIVQSAGPQFKVPIELLSGKKLFPNIKRGQPITDYMRYATEQLQAEGIYDIVAGKPLKKGYGYELLFKTLPVYKGDIKRFGWLATQQKVHDYIKNAGIGGSGFIVTESGNALYNMGVAYRYGDKKALSKYLGEFIMIKANQLQTKISPSAEIRKQWEKLDPLAKLTGNHRKLFLASLSKRDKYSLGLAYSYYAELRTGKQFYRDK